ncbi:carbohydrate esterase family 4 protein [Athelia psychrophila]|uniref:Carbohydrate esterase family 4 protein n=1 Tax=Athelia psychrophila TaxID=1759441 RepID=A0A166FWZ8_9AGAM|nr:carbohydrate esterase family 4 protein [Fibularhizoctonia sp. CBS 109695]
MDNDRYMAVIDQNNTEWHVIRIQKLSNSSSELACEHQLPPPSLLPRSLPVLGLSLKITTRIRCSGAHQHPVLPMALPTQQWGPRIPSIPPTTLGKDGVPVYANGYDPDSHTNDWSLTIGGTTSSKISKEMDKWLAGTFQSLGQFILTSSLTDGFLSGPHSPGLIILEHELSTQSVQAFIHNYPKMKANNWTVVSDARLSGQNAYQNSIDASEPVTPEGSVLVSSKKRSPRRRREDGN